MKNKQQKIIQRDLPEQDTGCWCQTVKMPTLYETRKTAQVFQDTANLASFSFFGKKKEEDEKDKEKPDYNLLKRYENRERDDLSNNIPGAIFTVQLDNSHPLAYGYANTYYTLKQDTRVFEFLKDECS